MSEELERALRDAGPHTARSLSARLPAFPPEAIAAALQTLAAQGVLAQEPGEAGEPTYRYVDPSRYRQANLDVVRDPGTGIRRRPRPPDGPSDASHDPPGDAD